jgi:hypothetical protein
MISIVIVLQIYKLYKFIKNLYSKVMLILSLIYCCINYITTTNKKLYVS